MIIACTGRHGLEPCLGALLDAGSNSVLAPAGGSLGKVPAIARAVDDAVTGAPVGLAGDLRLALGEQLDITGKHEGHRFLNTAVTLRQGLSGLFGDLGHGLTPRGTIRREDGGRHTRLPSAACGWLCAPGCHRPVA